MAVKNWSSSKHPSALNGASYLLLYLVQHVLWNLVSCFSKLHGIFILVPQKFCLCVKARCSGKLDRTGILITLHLTLFLWYSGNKGNVVYVRRDYRWQESAQELEENIVFFCFFFFLLVPLGDRAVTGDRA